MAKLYHQNKLYQHPFKEALWAMLRQHFDEKIVKRFHLTFESENIHSDASENIWRQLKDGVMCLEVTYTNPDDTSEFICDVWSNWSMAQTRATLLRHITDKFKVGKIGTDWNELGGRVIASEILDGKHETITD